MALSDQTQMLHLRRLLIERYGFEKTFLITASIKSLSYFALVPLLPLVSCHVAQHVLVPSAAVVMRVSQPECARDSNRQQHCSQ